MNPAERLKVLGDLKQVMEAWLAKVVEMGGRPVYVGEGTHLFMALAVDEALYDH